MNRLEGANCAGLPAFVIDKYFDCDGGREPFRRQVALQICARCLVREACREDALNGPRRERGVIGGLTAPELRNAKQWRAYEVGARSAVPRGERPEWLERPDAAETTEQTMHDDDPDEPAPEQ